MKHWNLLLALAVMAAASAWLAVGVGGDDDARARRLHFSSLVLDTHIDTPLLMKDPDWDFGQEHQSGHVDLPRLKRGGLDAGFFSIYMPGTVTGPQSRQRRAENPSPPFIACWNCTGTTWNCAPALPRCAVPSGWASSPSSWGWREAT